MKRVEIIITETEKGASYDLKSEGLHHFELLGILRTAILLEERNLLKLNK